MDTKPHPPHADCTEPASSNGHHGSSVSRELPGTAKPLNQFQFLERQYGIETPSCTVPKLNELFKSVCERYDIAVTNREKVDEALTLFKRVLEVDRQLPMSECFAAWRSQLVNPKFTVVTKEPDGDVKQITVRAEEVPRAKRKAQKHIRDLLDACHLYLQQKDFLQRHIRSNLEEIAILARDTPGLCKDVQLSSSERKQLPLIVEKARDQFDQFPGTVDLFWKQVYSLLQEINTAVHVLQD